MSAHPDPAGGNRAVLITGLGLLALGAAAIAVPGIATLAIEQLVAGLCLVSGAAGLGVALSLRPAAEWRMTAALFVLLAVLGLVLLLFPADGARTLTMLLAVVFFVQGCASVSFGFGLRGILRNGGLLVLSGAASLVVGGMIVAGWPDTAAWVLGLLTGVNLVSNGLVLALLGAGRRPGGRA
ncbi:MAG: DUF308 domain-containing protein [Rhodobacteraceae bacterium]|jgi:uncharacterized membrane protein HdeD (DUF308 family)|nr:DUF308 domain-containing protein [Paracoccaceae bacterium]